jgi:hypothetical protein
MNYQNLWNTAMAVLRGKFISMSAYIKRTERSQINNLMRHLKLLEKQEQENSKTSRRREIIKIMAKINEIETKKKKELMKQKSSFLEKTNKIDLPLASLTKKKREKKSQISKMRYAKGEKTTNTKEIQEITRDYFENLYSNKFENL